MSFVFSFRSFVFPVCIFRAIAVFLLPLSFVTVTIAAVLALQRNANDKLLHSSYYLQSHNRHIRWNRVYSWKINARTIEEAEKITRLSVFIKYEQCTNTRALAKWISRDQCTMAYE